MIKDIQVKKLRKYRKTNTIKKSALKAGMSERSGGKYLRTDQMPSDLIIPRNWKTREDPFFDDSQIIQDLLENCPGIEGKTIFEELQRRSPGKYPDGQLRTMQRRVRQWRATEGPPKEVFFPQVYTPGKMGSFDFTHMNELGVTIQESPFPHMLFHFVLPYSNWEIGNICFSESFESLSEGLQNALLRLGGVPEQVRSDRLSAAISNLSETKEFTKSYNAILDHYGMRGIKTNPNSGHENGDAEQSHYRFKKAAEQYLLLRGSRDFSDRKEYQIFLDNIFNRKNENRNERFSEEQKKLRPLPDKTLQVKHTLTVRVSSYSTIQVRKNTYSVNSRLINEMVKVVLGSENIDVYHGIRKVESIPRISGEGKHFIQYRHIIDSLVRKPGAFENYRYKEEMFPTIQFRIAYDLLREKGEPLASRIYVKLLELAAKESETLVNDAIRTLIDKNHEISLDNINHLLASNLPAPITHVNVETADLLLYDELICNEVA